MTGRNRPNTFFVAYGPQSGGCDHRHASLKKAEECIDQDILVQRDLGKISDRAIYDDCMIVRDDQGHPVKAYGAPILMRTNNPQEEMFVGVNDAVLGEVDLSGGFFVMQHRGTLEDPSLANIYVAKNISLSDASAAARSPQIDGRIISRTANIGRHNATVRLYRDPGQGSSTFTHTSVVYDFSEDTPSEIIGSVVMALENDEVKPLVERWNLAKEAIREMKHEQQMAHNAPNMKV